MFCSFCRQDERNCECAVRKAAGPEYSSDYLGALLPKLAGKPKMYELCQEEDDTEPTNECACCNLTFDIDALDEDGVCQRCNNIGYCGRCQNYDRYWGCSCNDEPEEEVERVRCQDCRFWYWEEELIEGLCELCQETSKEIWCDICSGREDLDLVVAGLYYPVKTCQDHSFEIAKELLAQNIGYCERCQEFGPRYRDHSYNLCYTCNSRAEI